MVEDTLYIFDSLSVEYSYDYTGWHLALFPSGLFILPRCFDGVWETYSRFTNVLCALVNNYKKV